ncbi:YiiD C-terminal domain-containing protein [Arhodomonas sp. SL1]|uniref:YiiD C-terminal domain-containing protein n=1 Tax=Arhodomonas sp. SL1 TaxID=3425691 RepID=UPI003F880432
MWHAIDLQTRLRELIPPARFMGVRVEYLGDDGVAVSAPIDANHNHAGTGFAGSLYSLACLAGWGWLYACTRCHGLEPQLVLAEGDIQYLHPAHGELRAVLAITDDQAAALLEPLRRGRRARSRLVVHLPDANQPAARFEGVFAALP